MGKVITILFFQLIFIFSPFYFSVCSILNLSTICFCFFLSPFFVASGLSTIRSHFSIAFVSASSSISVNSSPPTAAYELCWYLYLHILCTGLPIHLCVCFVCKTCLQASTFRICGTASLSYHQRPDDTARTRSIFSHLSCFSCNTCWHTHCRTSCTKASIHSWICGLC